MPKFLVVAALRSEFFSTNKLIREIHYTGVGKVNSSRAVTELILLNKPDLIVNLGSAGCLRQELLGDVFGVEQVIERDMMAEPLAPRGTVPFDFEDSVFKSDFGTVKCATGDSFVTSSDPWLTNHKVDLVYMELFAIAKVAHFYGVNWRSIKYASDLANEDASRDWNSSLEDCSRKINEIVEQALLG